MKTEFIFWAQPLDNVSPDIVYRFGRPISAESPTEREKAISEFSTIVKRGNTVAESDGFRLISSRGHFFVEVPCEQKDNSNRVAPVVCSGPYDNAGEDFGETVAKEIQVFAESIDRTIAPESREKIIRAFCDLRKKNFQRKVLGVAALAGVVLIAWWVLYRQ